MPDRLFHPLADAFPLMDGAAFDELAASISANGLRHPIVLFNDMILDGRNRFRACEKAGIVPQFEEFTGTDPLTFVVDENLNRRHMNESQRAMVAAKLANLQRGSNRFVRKVELEISTSTTSVSEAARLMNVDPSSVFHAKKVLKDGTPEEIKAVEDGKVGASTVAKQISAGVPPEERAHARQKSKAKGHDARSETQRARGTLWSNLRDALTHLNDLPAPNDVADELRKLGGMKADRDAFLKQRLPQAIHYLQEFLNEWERDTSADRAA